MGSGFALRAALEILGKNARVVCPEEIPEKFHFIAKQKDIDYNIKTVIAVDVADDKLLGNLKEVYEDRIELCIDHHRSNTEYAKRLSAFCSFRPKNLKDERLSSEPSQNEIAQALEKEGIKMAQAEVTMIPQNYVELTADEDVTNINRILDLLDAEDDVQEVYHNWDE